MSAQLQQPQKLPAHRRAMLPADVDAVLAIEATAYSHPWTRGNFMDSLAAGYRAQVLSRLQGQGEHVIGYFVAMPGVDELHLLNITVAPGWQGQGHGHALLDAVLDLARQQQAAMLWLEVRHSNHRARALYRRRGFAEVGLRRGYYPAAGGREDAVVMSLPVTSAGGASAGGASASAASASAASTSATSAEGTSANTPATNLTSADAASTAAALIQTTPPGAAPSGATRAVD